MRVLPIPDLLTYISQGNETTKSLIDSKSDLYEGVKTFYDFFANDFLTKEELDSPIAAFLAMNAFMLYTSSIRMTLTGHVAATPPLFRTALESACYAYLIQKDPVAESIWLSRHRDENALVDCRRYFTSAVKKVAQGIAVDSPHHEGWINDGYQATIDFGAHPNPLSVIGHLNTVDREDELQEITLIGLYSSESFEIKHHLMGCLDYGLLIAIIITHSLKQPSADLSRKLFELNELKEKLTEEHFS